MAYPPYTRLISLRLKGNSEAKTFRVAKWMEQIARRVLQKGKEFQEQVEILGPTMAPLAKIKGKCRYHMLLKGKKWSILHDFAGEVLQRAEEEISIPGVKWTVDVDPVNML